MESQSPGDADGGLVFAKLGTHRVFPTTTQASGSCLVDVMRAVAATRHDVQQLHTTKPLKHSPPKFQVPVKLSSPSTKEDQADVAASASTPTSAASMVQVRCPMDFSPSDVPGHGVYGMKRVTRHPTFWSLGLLGLGTAFTTPFAPEVVMFTAPAVFALVGGAHQDYRNRYGRGSGSTCTLQSCMHRAFGQASGRSW